MSKEKPPNYWVFANKPEGTYGDTIWDMSTILRTECYPFNEDQPNRAYVKPGDVVYMRIYGESYIGRFVIGGKWAPLPTDEQKEEHITGTFPMPDIQRWSRPVPQILVMGELSNQDVMSRIISIKRDDSIIIETAQRVYQRLGFGGADGEIVILEKGLEEAIKPNLKQLGLTLVEERIQQQFAMGLGVGRADLICTDENDDIVVIELKRGMTSDEAIGQVLRYVGWVKENIAGDQRDVHGWIVTGDYDEHLRLAASAANIRLLLVRLG